MAHSEETKRKIGIANKGKLKGKKKDPESVRRGVEKRKRGSFFNCLICEKEFWRAPNQIEKGYNKYCNKFCYQKSQIGKPKSEAFKAYCRTRKGEKSATWKGGITLEHLRIRNSQEYREWRTRIFIRDNYECQNCNARNGNGKDIYLHVHHIKSFSEYPDLRFDMNNGITLCKKCHYKEHTNG